MKTNQYGGPHFLYLENTSTYETFSYHASVNARQGTYMLDQDYLYWPTTLA